jgi:hypothetical protein
MDFHLRPNFAIPHNKARNSHGMIAEQLKVNVEIV